MYLSNTTMEDTDMKKTHWILAIIIGMIQPAIAVIIVTTM